MFSIEVVALSTIEERIQQVLETKRELFDTILSGAEPVDEKTHSFMDLAFDSGATGDDTASPAGAAASLGGHLRLGDFSWMTQFFPEQIDFELGAAPFPFPKGMKGATNMGGEQMFIFNGDAATQQAAGPCTCTAGRDVFYGEQTGTNHILVRVQWPGLDQKTALRTLELTLGAVLESSLGAPETNNDEGVDPAWEAAMGRLAATANGARILRQTCALCA